MHWTMSRVLWITFLCMVASYVTSPLIDPDLWWHLTVGRWIVAHGSLPQQDYWNLFGAGRPWLAYSWSNEVFYAVAFAAAEERGLVMLKLLLGCGLAASLAIVYAKLARNWFLGALIGAFVLASCHSHFTLRPQSAVWIIFVWLLYWVQRRHLTPASWRPLIAIFLLSAAWANTHLSIVLGIVSAGLWLVEREHPARGLSVRSAVGAIVAIGAGSLATPYLGGEWRSFFEHASHPLSFKTIAEFQPLTIMHYHTGFLLLLVVLVAALHAVQPHLVIVSRILLVSVLTIGACAVSKMMPFAMIALGALFAERVGSAKYHSLNLGRIDEALERLWRLVQWFPTRELSFVFLCLTIVNSINLWRSPVFWWAFPRESVDFIVQKQLPLPILNLFGDGGYLIHRLSTERGEPFSDRHRVAIDGRTNVVPPDVWTMYFAARSGTEGWRSIIERADPGTILWRANLPLTSILTAEGVWCIVHRSSKADDAWVVLLPREVAEQAQLKCDNDSGKVVH